MADAGRLRQILANLLSNAVKFTDAGRDRGAGRVPPAAGRGRTAHELAFSVRDTGIGHGRPTAAERLFAPFTQVDASTTRLYGGTGLGLAISRRLCELMGGAMRVETRHSGAGPCSPSPCRSRRPPADRPSRSRPESCPESGCWSWTTMRRTVRS